MHRPLALTFASLLSTIAPLASAQDEADTLLEEGKALLKAGKTAEACSKMEASHAKKPSSGSLLDVALCHEKQGKIATAWVEYGEVAALARRDRRPDREQTAAARGRALTPKLPRLTVNVAGEAAQVAGLQVQLDGTPVDKGGWGQPIPVDPGEHLVSASAPGRAPWEGKVTVRIADKKGIAVPLLKEDKNAAAAAAPPAVAPEKAEAPQPAKPEATAAVSAPPDAPPQRGHRADRLVVELGAVGAFLYGGVDGGDFEGLAALDYPFLAADAQYLQACGTENCTVTFDTSPGVYVGGTVFVGWAMSEKLHVGGRAFGGPRIKGGWFIAGGPSLSYDVGPVWLGLTGLVGAMEQEANIESIRGKGPPGVTTVDGSEEVDVPLKEGIPTSATVSTELAFGGSIEISLPLADNDSGFFAGALSVGLWPTFLQGFNGFALAIPLGLSYRMY